MSSGASDNNSPEKPHLHAARSFPRMDSSNTGPFVRSRAKTVQSVALPESVDSDGLPLSLSMNEDDQDGAPDVFEKSPPSEPGLGDDSQQTEEASVLSRNVQDRSEELPIELISLTDRFVDSLSAKVHSSPPTIDKISNLFQDFYLRAESHIATHISTLASRINRDPSSFPIGKTRSNSKDADSITSSRQMLTASEVAEKRTARKLLASKRIDLEEAVERRACERIYHKLWRHKTTLDEVRDEKLRSKTAALLLVGINLKDLGVDIDISAISEEKQKEADEGLSVARDFLAKMNDEQYPLGKLRHLAAAHKAIVDALTKLLSSSSSADEILPALIYTLTTCPPEGINIISNLLFIQRFRSSNKIDGETAYCLTNLEAAISFLENVDLSELRADELQEGQPKAPSDDSTFALEKIESLQVSQEVPTSSVSPVTASAEPSKPASKDASSTLPRPQPSTTTAQPGRLNNLFQPPSRVLGAANDAVRSTADQGLKNISASLDSSFNFLFGRLKELQSNQAPGTDGSGPLLPKTLAEARRLVTAPAASDNSSLNQEEGAVKEPPSVEQPRLRRIGSKAEDTFLGLVGGQRTPRDRSVESVRTQGSSKMSAVAPGVSKDEPHPATPGSASFAPTPLESMRNFGNTLNPLNHIPGMIRNFGRATPEPAATLRAPSPSDRFKSPTNLREVSSNVPSSTTKIDPPIQRLLQIQNADELTIGDVRVLLEDYKRLSAAILKQGSAFK